MRMDLLNSNQPGLSALPDAEDERCQPVAVYLGRLGAGSRRTMKAALNTIASIASHGELDASTFPWGQLRFQESQRVRAELADRYAHTTANKILAALRGVLREAWRLDQIPIEDYHRAVDLQPVRGQRLPA